MRVIGWFIRRSGSARLMWSGWLSLVGLVGCSNAAFAHDGLPPTPEIIWSTWNWELQILLGLVLAAAGYYRGVWQLWRRAGVGQVIARWQAAAFGSGLVTLFVALISPLDALGTALFSAHMIQHLLLMVVAAPLLVLGAPLVPVLWALPRSTRHAVGRSWHRAGALRAAWHGLNHPLLVWLLYAAALWVWHLPVLFQAALEEPFIHELEHISFLGTALLFWWVLIQPVGRRRLSYTAGVLFVFTTALHSCILGALIALARTPLYPIYAARVWNTTVLEDQQLAGLIMWMPMGFIYLMTVLVLLGLWLQKLEHRQGLREARLRAIDR